VQLLEGERRDISAMNVLKVWRERAGSVPDAESILYKSELRSAGNPVEVHLSIDDQNRLVAAAEDLKRKLREFQGVFDVADSFHSGKMEMQIRLKSEARSLGLTLNDIALQVRHAFYGAEALRFQRDQDEVKVLVRYPEDETKSQGNVEDMRIRLLDGTALPFSQVAKVEMEQGYAVIQRAQRLRVVKVTADVDENITNANEVRMALQTQILPHLKDSHPGLRYSMEGEGKEQTESLTDVFKSGIIALFAIYTLLAVPFRSFSQPIIVMLAIPFGLIGAVGGHMLMGYNLSLLSLLGMVGLAGVVVNDSLVLIHKANSNRVEGLGMADSVKSAAQSRFRAILLTSLTTFAGLSPMIWEKSLQAQFLIPMAVSLGFGVLFATVITLVLIPCGYLIMDDLGKILARGAIWLGLWEE
jgi:multidrug efflux pump subunit AcrB